MQQAAGIFDCNSAFKLQSARNAFRLYANGLRFKPCARYQVFVCVYVMVPPDVSQPIAAHGSRSAGV